MLCQPYQELNCLICPKMLLQTLWCELWCQLRPHPFSHFQDSRTSPRGAVTWEGKRRSHECASPPPPFPELLLLTVSGGSIPSVGWGQLFGLCPLPTPCPSPTYLLWGQSGKKKKAKEKKSCEQHWHWCVIDTVLVTDAKHSTVGIAAEEINSIPGRLRT